MKSIYFGLVLLIWVNSVFAQTTPIPDSNFESFLIAQGIDSNGANGNILNSDAAAVTTLNVTANNITNFSGLQAFVNLVSLNLGSNQFTTVPLSALVDLEEFRFSGNDILDNLDVSNNTKLRVFIARGSGLGSDATILSIDLSNNVLLEDIQVYAFRDLDDVILPVTTTVENLYLLIFNTFTVDLSGYQNMHTLFLSTNFNNTFPINADLPDFPNVLRNITVQGGNLGLVDISQQLVLERLRLQSTNVQNINLPVTNTLREIDISGHRISNINFQNASMLERLTITGKSMPGALTINVNQNPNLNYLSAYSNYMTAVNVTQNPLLETLYVYTNELTSLDVTQNPVLETLNARYNLLTGINVTQNPVLKTLNLSHNQIPNLNVTQNSLLEQLTISQNLFSGTGLDLTNNTNLKYLDASENEIESLDISHTVVEDLILHHNSFTGKDILDQYFDIWNANGGLRYSNTLDVSFNRLTGKIPDFASLIVPNVTRSFSFKIDNNNFHFGDFEEEHSAYVNALTTVVNTWYTIFDTYTYAPQSLVNAAQTLNQSVGTQVTLTTTVRGTQNHYQWYKDGVAIPSAPDSPDYTFYTSPCDQGVYYCIVTSDLVPFENGNPPGAGGKNLQIQRRNITLNVSGSPTKQCVDLTDPLNNATNVPVDSNITWEVAPGACGYRISLGTNAAANNILANEDLGNTLTYDPPANLLPNTDYYIRIVPYYTDGDQTGCVIQTFSTGVGGTAPTCTTITSPGNGATDIALDAAITWTAVSDADGYYVTIGTTSGGNELVDAISVTGTSYTHTSDFAENTTYYVSVVPYNSVGEAAGCSEISFTTETLATAPNCTTITSPGNGSTDIALDAAITWTSVSDADGYYVTIGTTSGGNELVDAISVTGTSYTHTSDFAENTTYYVSIVPYNSVGEATGCSEISFTTETLATVPDCTTITSPGNGATDIALDAAIIWTAVSGADGYYVTIGTTSGGNELVDAISVTGTSFTHTSDFAENTTYYVSIVPYNSVGEATGCSEISFTTETLATAPNCTTITFPGNGSTDIALDATITWTAVSDADGYYVTIGTTSGGNELVDAISVTGTSYTHTSDFAENTTYYVSVVPYNSVGEASGCSEISFTTETLASVPDCTTITSPGNGATDIALDAAITWTSVADADGYYVTIGTTSGGNELVDAISVTGTSYSYTSDFAENTTYYVSVVPYNSVGEATGCSEISFTTETLATAPNCTTITSPGNSSTDIALDAAITWTAVSDADGFYVTIGTTSGGNELVDAISVTGTSYAHTSDFAENTTYYVSVVPYNSVGEAAGCAEIFFTTAAANVPTSPACTTITSPGNGLTDITLDAAITWTAVSDADGYYVTIGTTTGGNELVDAITVTGTSYSHTSDFAENTTYYVSVVPYNSVGEATGCAEISFTTETLATVPDCTTITSPGNGATDIALDAAITWTAVSDADGYYVTIGTTSGGNELVDAISITGTSYTHTSDYSENTTYFVSVVPYNAVGEATGCSEISFTTETLATAPNCTTITSPGNSSTDIALDAAITWTAVSDADGFYVTIGTTSGGNELVDAISVTGTSYAHTSDFAENTTYYVSVVPYNSVGEAAGCAEISFTTETLATVPECTTITSPGNGSTDIALDAVITWTAVSDADGYYVTIGTTSGGNELVDAISVTGTSYAHASDFAENTTYYVSVVPYNSVGEADGCAEIIFTTAAANVPTPPACTTITSPGNGATDIALDAAITWTSVADADGYYVTIGTTSGGNELVDVISVTGTSYTHTSDFAENTTYYVSVIPYNSVGEADGCAEISFTTAVANVPTPPACTAITSPGNGATDIALDAAIIWTTVSDADGYYLTIGTTSGGNELVDGVSVTGTSYTHTSDFAENTTYYVSVVPFNSVGEATGCSEISFTTAAANVPTPPVCTTITSPGNEARDIALDAAITWTAVLDADGYFVTIGTTSGGNELVDAISVTGTSYSPTSDFAENTTYFVSVVPYNSVGEADGCSEISFTTAAANVPTPPACTAITSPGNGATDIALDAAITWTAVSDADGYYVTIGSTSGGNELVDAKSVTGTSYTHTSDFAENTTYYVTVIPYNSVGEAAGCAEISFTTETLATPPACTAITSPGNGATDIALDAAITWTTVSDADGYYVTIGTTTGGNELVDAVSVTETSYTHTSGFAENTTFYVSVVPYNAVGEAEGCTEISFTTAAANVPTPPACTTITSPGNGSTDVALDAAIIWTAVLDSDGYYVTIGTTSGGNELVDAVSVTGTSYTHTSDYAENTTYYVSVVPYNSDGEATGCAEISFTTAAANVPTPPACTTITSPGNGATDIALDAAITWTAVSDADGYYVTIGTTAGGNELVDAESVTGTSYTHPSDFAENTTYYVSLVPYNSVGEAAGCAEISFTTESLPTPPDCTLISFPNNQNNGIPVMSIISWQEVENAEGYYVTLTQTSSGEAVLSNQLVFETSIDLSGLLEYGQEYEISVIPFNGQGEAESCGSSLFTTESLDFYPKTKYGISPNGDGINDFWEIEGIESFPDNKVAVYNRWGDKVFEVQSYDNQLNVFEGRANRLQYLGAGELPEGTYFFEIQILSEEAKGKYRGFLIIKR